MLRTEVTPSGIGVRRDDGQWAFAKQPLTTAGDGLGETWAKALKAAGGASPRARVAVSIDNAFCWLDSVEGDFAAMRTRALDGIAQAALAEVLGDEAADHELRWQVQHDGRHMLLVAVPRSLMAAVQKAADENGLRIAALNATFVDQWNHCGRTLGIGDGVVALVRRGCATLVRVRGAAITALGCEHVGNSVSELNQATRRLLARFGDDIDAGERRVMVSPDAWSEAQLGAWTLHRPGAAARSARS